MSTISTLWANRNLPIRDGLYYADGRSYELTQDASAPLGIEIGPAFDLDSFLRAEPDWVTSIDVLKSVQINEAEGYLHCGEGSYGSEGFIAKTDGAGGLLWAVYMEYSNPFHEIKIVENLAIFRSTSGVLISAAAQGESFQPKE